VEILKGKWHFGIATTFVRGNCYERLVAYTCGSFLIPLEQQRKVKRMQSMHSESPEEAGYLNGAPNILSIEDDYYSEDEFEMSDNSCAEGFYYEGDDWNTDDEVEEANANDDITKMIEGDW
jgi:hypothetical protein